MIGRLFLYLVGLFLMVMGGVITLIYFNRPEPMIFYYVSMVFAGAVVIAASFFKRF